VHANWVRSDPKKAHGEEVEQSRPHAAAVARAYTYAREAGSSASSRRHRYSPTPSDDDWGTEAKEELAPPPVKIFEDMDFIDNDEAEVSVVEKFHRISEREATDPRQREEEDACWVVLEVRAYEEFQREAVIRRMKTERVDLE
jgi:hypothetical protein